jgi:head-tail adaptor
MAEDKIQAGLFSENVALDKATKSAANDYGESTNSWTTNYKTMWVKIDYLSGSSEVKNDVEQRIQKIKITGYYEDLANLIIEDTNLFRFQVPNLYNAALGNRFYFITEVKPIGFNNKEFVEVYCKGRY